MANCHVQLIADRDAFLKLEPEWNRLLQRSRSDSIFLSWDWVSAWWEVFGPRFTLSVLAAREGDGTLVGIAPLMIGRSKTLVGRGIRVLLFIGQRGDTLAEYLDFFVERGREEEVTTRFAEFLVERRGSLWDIWDLAMMLVDSPNVPILERVLENAGVEHHRRRRSASPYLALPGTWDELLQSKSRNFRGQWNNANNRLRRIGDLHFKYAGTDVPPEVALDTVAELNHRRWGGRGRSFRSAEYMAFHRALSNRLAGNGELMMVLLELAGEVVAARYDFVYGEKMWCFQGGWMPEYEGARVGTVLTGTVIQWGIERGCTEYDFLSGDEPYKRRWSTGVRQLMNLEVFDDSSAVRRYRRYMALRNRLRDGIPAPMRRLVQRSTGRFARQNQADS